ncbi:hypothetical protein [Nocardioides terrisoli]|uniref:hypothetical protein n=1 Tax=Nocardioides terrisoli TaxID=3388267 RepID=UPI00287BA807|nr:hypothetical protein [Nocardioides marmorisolisilvae]
MPNLTGRQAILLTAAAFMLATAAAGIYGLVRGPGGASARIGTGQPGLAQVVTPPDPPAATLKDRSLPHTKDPIAYARAVATSLFDWDAASGYLPADYDAVVIDDADPSGEETPGLLDDVATYLPTTDQWLDLGAMNVVQSIDIENSYIPDSWTSALAQSHGQLRPGTSAVTITGARDRSGVWGDKSANSSSPVSFTVFVACPPAFGRCHVLRLSQLDNPLK